MFPVRFLFRVAPLACILAGTALPWSAKAASAIATAAAERGTAYYWVIDQPSQAAAKSEALRRCTAQAAEDGHRAGCKLGESADGPRHWAVVTATNGGLGWKHAASPQEAIDGAYKDCLRQSRGRCHGSAAAVWFDGVAADGSTPPAPAPATADYAIPPSAMQPSGQWSKLHTTPEVQFLVDRATLRQSGDTVTAWVLYSMADESSANLNEHKCKTDEYRTLRWRQHAQPLAKGGAVEGGEPERWRTLAEDKFYAEAMPALCRIAATLKKSGK